MLVEKIDDDELEIMGFLHHPRVATECLFPAKAENFESLKNYPGDDYDDRFRVRLYQLSMQSYEYLLAEDPKLTPEQNFRLKKGAGDIFNYCGRKTGKSIIAIIIDLLLDSIHNIIDWVTVFSSLDEQHIKPILDPLINILENHPFFALFEYTATRTPHYEIKSKIFGHKLEGINMRIKGRDPGQNFERIHCHKITIDEHQYETEEVYNRRTQSTSEKGAIERYNGICSFKRHSPAGRIFYNLKNKNKLVNFPSYIAPHWKKLMKEKTVEEYDGQDTISYKVNIAAEVVENMLGLYDIDRIRECYNDKKKVKTFEINKESFNDYEDIIILDKWKNALRTWVASDIGHEGAPTEIIILFEVEHQSGNIFHYAYNVVLNNLTVEEEQFAIFKYIIKLLNPNFVGLDTTNPGAGVLYRSLCKEFPEADKKGCFSAVGFNQKIMVDVETDENGNVKVDDAGKEIKKYEYVSEWSIRCLKKLFYNKKVEIPEDFKFDKQFNNMRAIKSGNRTIIKSLGADHNHQSWQVAAIMWWSNEFNLQAPIDEEWGLGVNS